MALAYHGNYVGPGWSAGKYQSSVESDVLPVDDFDATGKRHDAVYARGGNRAIADLEFAYDNLTTFNPKRWLAGALVGAQGVYRVASDVGTMQKAASLATSGPAGAVVGAALGASVLHKYLKSSQGHDKDYPPLSESEMKNKQNRIYAGDSSHLVKDSNGRREIERIDKQITKSYQKRKPMKQRMQQAFSPLKTTNAPVSIGTTLVAVPPQTVKTSNGVCIAGREFIAQVFGTNNDSFQVAALAPVHPAYYPASTMGNISRSYQYYRFRKIVAHFVTRQPTSVTGEIVMCYSKNILDPPEDGNSGSFLPRAMTRGNAVIGPLWQNHSVEVPVDGVFRLVDAFNASTLADNINGEVQVYTQSNIDDTCGYLVWDYVLEFSDTMFTAHASSLPLTSGPGTKYSVSIAASAANDALIGTSALITAYPNQTVWSLALDLSASTAGTGATLANLVNVFANYHTTTSTFSQAGTNLPLVDGQRVFGMVVGGVLYFYSSYEAAVAGAGSAQMYIRTATSTASTLVFNGYLVRLGPVELTSAN